MRQTYEKDGAIGNIWPVSQRAAVRFGDGVADRQPQPGGILAGGKERIEDAFRAGLIQSRAGITHRDLDLRRLPE